MTALHAILHNAGNMTIEELERHLQERSALVDQIRAEQAAIVPALDLKLRVRAMTHRGPGQSQTIGVTFEVLNGK